MNNEVLEFLLRVSLIWAGMLFFYKWALGKSDNWRFKNRFLLLAYLAGIVIPLLPPLVGSNTIHAVKVAPIVFEKTIAIENVAAVSDDKTGWLSFLEIIWGIYLVGVTLYVLQLLVHYFQLRQWKIKGKKYFFQSSLVIKHPKVPAPFAGLGAIFLPLTQDKDTEGMVCLHEATHLRLGHNLERIPLILGQVIFWFHPLQWVFRKWQSEIQEFEADEAVLQEYSPSEYGKLLIQTSMLFNINWRARFFSSPLKKRIHMMTKEKNSYRWHIGHTLIFVVLSIFMLSNCSDLINQVDLSDQEEFLLSEVDQVPALKTIDGPIASKLLAERKFLEHIYKNIKYPAVSRQNGIQGNFKASFIIDEKGKMTSLKVDHVADASGHDHKIVVVGYAQQMVKGSLNQEKGTQKSLQGDKSKDRVVEGYLNPEKDSRNLSKEFSPLQQEIKRTLNTLPDWQPAQRKGQAVASRLNVLIQYKLER